MVCKKAVESIIASPSSEQLNITRHDINETSEEKLEHNVKLIEEWAKCQSHFSGKKIEKCFIKGFLRGCRHNLDKTKKKLEQHLAARSLYQDVYADRSPYSKDIAQIMDVINIVNLPKLNDKGQRIWILKLERTDIADFNMNAAIKLFFMMYDFLMTSKEPTNGEIVIFDSNKFSASHFSKFLANLKKATDLLKESYAIRLKEMHLINAPNMIEKVMSVIKPMLHPNVRNSLKIHKTPQHLLDNIGPELLPSNYGGHQKDLRQLAEDWYEVLTDNADWFKKQEDMKITGSLSRTNLENKLHFREEIGVEGSFRKLSID